MIYNKRLKYERFRSGSWSYSASGSMAWSQSWSVSRSRSSRADWSLSRSYSQSHSGGQP
jgi:hypothetical protein